MRLLTSLLVLLLLFGGAFARAPSWIAVGTSINYTVGSSLYTFTVTEITSSQIKIDLKASSSTSRLIDNATADSGQFWFDPTLLTSASAGRSIGDYSVVSTGEDSYAGKTFHTATLQIVLGGATTTKVFDVESGLLLDQRSSASGSSPVLIRNYFVQAWAPPPPNVTAPAPTPTVNTTPTAPAPTTPTSTPNATTPTPTPTSNSTSTPTPSPSTTAPTQTSAPASSSTCPCPESLFFVLLGVLAVGKKVEKI